jgi:hypothetical protein
VQLNRSVKALAQLRGVPRTEMIVDALSRYVADANEFQAA